MSVFEPERDTLTLELVTVDGSDDVFATEAVPFFANYYDRRPTAPAPSNPLFGRRVWLEHGILRPNANGRWVAVISATDGSLSVRTNVVTINVAPQPDPIQYTQSSSSTTIQEDDHAGLAEYFRDGVTLATGVTDPDGDVTVELAVDDSSDDLFIITQPPIVFASSGATTAPGDAPQAAIIPAGRLRLRDHAHGAWTATARLIDGSSSPPETAMAGVLRIEVSPVADSGPPTFVSITDDFMVAEAVGVNTPLLPRGLLVNLVEPDGEAVTVSLVNAGPASLFATPPRVIFSPANATVASNTHFTPQNIAMGGGVLAADETGVWTAAVEVRRGTDTWTVASVTISVVAEGGVNSAPTYVPSAFVTVLNEENAQGVLGAMTLATGVSDADGDELMVELDDISGEALFATQPAVAIESNGAARVIVLRGGVLSGALGEWRATARLTDGATVVPMGVVRVVVRAANRPPTFDVGDLSLPVVEDSGGVPPLSLATGVRDEDADLLTVVTVNQRGSAGLFASTPRVAFEDGGRTASGRTEQVIVLEYGVLAANANGEWTVTVSLSDGDTTVRVGVARVEVIALNDEPTFAVGLTSTTVLEDSGVVPALVVATNVRDIENEDLTVALDNVVGAELFATPPVVAFRSSSATTAPGSAAQEVALHGGVLMENANGEWRATVLLSDGVETVTVDVVSIEVTPVPDELTFDRSSSFINGTLATVVDEDAGAISLTLAENVLTPDGLVRAELVGVISVAVASGASPELFASSVVVFESSGEATAPGNTPQVAVWRGELAANANGEWTATAFLRNGAIWHEIGKVSVSVRAVPDNPVAVAVPGYRVTAEVAVPGLIVEPTVEVDVAEGTFADHWPLTVSLFDDVYDPDGGVLTLVETRISGDRSFLEGPLVEFDPAGAGASTATNLMVAPVRLSQDRSMLSTSTEVVFTPQTVRMSSRGRVLPGMRGAYRARIQLMAGSIEQVAAGTTDLRTATVAYTIDITVRDKNAPTFTPGATLSVTMSEDSDDAVPNLTLATNARDADSDRLTLAFGNRSTELEARLFSTPPSLIFESREARTAPGNAPQVALLRGGALRAHGHGVWTATIELSDGTETVEIGVATIDVTPVSDAPVFEVDTLETTITAGDTREPLLALARRVADFDGDMVTASLANISGEALFATQPQALFLSNMASVVSGSGSEVLFLRGGVLTENLRQGEWTATVLLIDDADAGATTVTMGVARVVVVEPAPMFMTATLVTQVLTVLADDATSRAVTMTVATDVRDRDGDDVTVSLMQADIAPFSMPPSVVFESNGATTAPGDAAQIIVLRGALPAGASGVYTGTVLLSGRGNELVTTTIGVVRIFVHNILEADTATYDATGPLTQVPGAQCAACGAAYLCDTVAPTSVDDLSGEHCRLVEQTNSGELIALPPGQRSVWWSSTVTVEGSEHVALLARDYTVLPLLQFGAGTVVVPAGEEVSLPLPISVFGDYDAVGDVIFTATSEQLGDALTASAPLSRSQVTISATVSLDAGSIAVYSLEADMPYSRHSSTELTVVAAGETTLARATNPSMTLRHWPGGLATDVAIIVTNAAIGARLSAVIHVERLAGDAPDYEIGARLVDENTDLEIAIDSEADRIITLTNFNSDLVNFTSGVLIVSVREAGSEEVIIEDAWPVVVNGRFDEVATVGSFVDADRDGVVDDESGDDGAGYLAVKHDNFESGVDGIVAASGQALRLGRYIINQPSTSAAQIERRSALLTVGEPIERLGETRLRNIVEAVHDYRVSLALGQRVATVVLPLVQPVPASPQVHKYRDGLGWSPFVTSGGDFVMSAPQPCPAPDLSRDLGWRDLTAGDGCLLVAVTDGGENDDDGVVNYIVFDPIVVGTRGGATGGSGGGGAIASVVLLSLLAVLAAIFLLTTRCRRIRLPRGRRLFGRRYA